MCSWSNTQNVKMDKLDWELTSPETEKHYSIPAADHTLGTERGKPERDKQGTATLTLDIVKIFTLGVRKQREHILILI